MYVIALKNLSNNKTVGFFQSDDEDVVQDKREALQLSDLTAAQREANACNATWDISSNQKFMVEAA